MSRQVVINQAPWSPQEVKYLLRAVQRGWTSQKIGDHMGRTRESVQRKIDRLGVSRPSVVRVQKIQEAIRTLMPQGLSDRDIARVTGFKYGVIAWHRKKLGLLRKQPKCTNHRYSPPAFACPYPPGSEGKIACLERRRAEQVGLWHPRDHLPCVADCLHHFLNGLCLQPDIMSGTLDDEV